MGGECHQEDWTVLQEGKGQDDDKQPDIEGIAHHWYGNIFFLSVHFITTKLQFSSVNSFVELVPLILKIPGASFFLSGKLNQDPLENFFGCIRQRGRVNNNPTVRETLKSAQTFRVISTIRFNQVVGGNCRGGAKGKALELEDIDMEPLKKGHGAPSEQTMSTDLFYTPYPLQRPCDLAAAALPYLYNIHSCQFMYI